MLQNFEEMPSLCYMNIQTFNHTIMCYLCYLKPMSTTSVSNYFSIYHKTETALILKKYKEMYTWSFTHSELYK